jgi:glycerate-2-kinase
MGTAGSLVLLENAAPLLDHGCADARRWVLDILDAALRDADPYEPVSQRVTVGPETLQLGCVRLSQAWIDRVFVIGAGKASQRIAQALEDSLGERLTGGLVVIKRGQAHRLRRLEVIDASHPLPDRSSVSAARRVLGIASRATARDLVITAISGGSSALLCLPPAGVSLRAKRELHRLLLACGAPIEQINAVRKHVSRIKGGRLAEAALPARVVNFVVSDVVSDPLDCVAGPVVADRSTVEDAVGVLRRYSLWEEVAPPIRAHLGGTGAETPRTLDEERVSTAYVMSVTTAGQGAARRAKALGMIVGCHTTTLEGESREVGHRLAETLRTLAEQAKILHRPVALVASGEMTVTMPEGGGAGGPNQEAGLSAALALEGVPNAAMAFLGTDGTDGPTTLAGAIVDGSTAVRARRIGLDLRCAVRDHDASPALLRLGDALVTGATGTNLADLVVGIALPESPSR